MKPFDLEKFLKTITFWEILKGMRLTLSTMFVKPVTQLYPWEMPTIPPIYRGLHAMLRKPDGTARCVACGLCAAYCPSNCIKIKSSDGPNHEKRLDSYEIDLLRCLFCGYCIEACPFNAITMTQDFEMACYDRKQLIYTKEMLLAVGDKYQGKETHLD